MNEHKPNPEIDYGPLAHLIGTWQGNTGLDVSPEPEGQEASPYYETLNYTAIGDVTNAESQQLAVVRYQQIVHRKSNDEVFHDETGYWMWDAEAATVMHSLAIPRGVCVLAGGQWSASENRENGISIAVSAKLGDPDWGIIQSPFMRDHAKTVEFRHEVSVEKDKLTYFETMVLEIYGKTFEHTDQNELIRS
jgi:hypothetical protein